MSQEERGRIYGQLVRSAKECDGDVAALKAGLLLTGKMYGRLELTVNGTFTPEWNPVETAETLERELSKLPVAADVVDAVRMLGRKTLESAELHKRIQAMEG